MSIQYHSISEIPVPKRNPFIGVLFETSLVPHFVLSSKYKEFINSIIDDGIYPDRKGALIGWFYIEDIMPNKQQYLNLVHFSARMDYYKKISI